MLPHQNFCFAHDMIFSLHEELGKSETGLSREIRVSNESS